MKGSLAASTVAAIESLIVRGRHSYGKLGRLIAPSEFLAGRLRDGGLASERIVVLPNFVPEEWFIASADDRTSASRPTFLFVGRLLEVKGIRLFLELARDMKLDRRLRRRR